MKILVCQRDMPLAKHIDSILYIIIEKKNWQRSGLIIFKKLLIYHRKNESVTLNQMNACDFEIKIYF